MHHTPPTRFDGYAIAIRQLNATQSFVWCPDGHHAVRPATAAAWWGTSSTRAASRWASRLQCASRADAELWDCLPPLRLFAPLATASRSATEQSPASEIQPIEPTLVTESVQLGRRLTPALVPTA